MNTITTTTASSATDNDAGCLRPLPPELDLVSIAEMTAQFEVLATEGFGAREGSADELLDRMAVIELAAGRRGICSVRDMLLNQHCLLLDLAEFEEVTGPPERDTSEDLHIYRNLMLAIAVSATESVGCSVARIYAQSVRLGPRTCASTRALASDEILLLRTMAMVEQLADSTSVVPVVYALMDAGLSVEETIHFAPEDFHAPEETFPFARVLAWGSSQYEPEVIRCDLFASCVLSRYTSTVLAAGASATEMLGGHTDTQDTSGWDAAERATDFVLNRFLDKAGLLHACHGITSDGSRRVRIEDIEEALD